MKNILSTVYWILMLVLLSTITAAAATPLCCDPDAKPDGRHGGGSSICIEGSSCCSDGWRAPGWWACNNGDGSSPCPHLGEICPQ